MSYDHDTSTPEQRAALALQRVMERSGLSTLIHSPEFAAAMEEGRAEVEAAEAELREAHRLEHLVEGTTCPADIIDNLMERIRGIVGDDDDDDDIETIVIPLPPGRSSEAIQATGVEDPDEGTIALFKHPSDAKLFAEAKALLQGRAVEVREPGDQR